jgi:hypothetical protein
MVSGLPRSWSQPSGWLASFFERIAANPQTFVCGIRWPDDERRALGARWHYKRAWVDPWREGDVIRIRFSNQQTMHIRLDPDPWWNGGGPKPRTDLLVLRAQSIERRTQVLVAVPAGHLSDFGVRAL